METKDERKAKVSANEMFLSAYANTCIAADEIMKLSEKNVGNITRDEILSMLKLSRTACAALEGLDVWRKNNPHPDER